MLASPGATASARGATASTRGATASTRGATASTRRVLACSPRVLASTRGATASTLTCARLQPSCARFHTRCDSFHTTCARLQPSCARLQPSCARLQPSLCSLAALARSLAALVCSLAALVCSLAALVCSLAALVCSLAALVCSLAALVCSLAHEVRPLAGHALPLAGHARPLAHDAPPQGHSFSAARRCRRTSHARPCPTPRRLGFAVAPRLLRGLRRRPAPAARGRPWSRARRAAPRLRRPLSTRRCLAERRCSPASISASSAAPQAWRTAARDQPRAAMEALERALGLQPGGLGPGWLAAAGVDGARPVAIAEPRADARGPARDRRPPRARPREGPRGPRRSPGMSFAALRGVADKVGTLVQGRVIVPALDAARAKKAIGALLRRGRPRRRRPRRVRPRYLRVELGGDGADGGDRLRRRTRGREAIAALRARAPGAPHDDPPGARGPRRPRRLQPRGHGGHRLRDGPGEDRRRGLRRLHRRRTSASGSPREGLWEAGQSYTLAGNAKGAYFDRIDSRGSYPARPRAQRRPGAGVRRPAGRGVEDLDVDRGQGRDPGRVRRLASLRPGVALPRRAAGPRASTRRASPISRAPRAGRNGGEPAQHGTGAARAAPAPRRRLRLVRADPALRAPGNASGRW